MNNNYSDPLLCLLVSLFVSFLTYIREVHKKGAVFSLLDLTIRLFSGAFLSFVAIAGCYAFGLSDNFWLPALITGVLCASGLDFFVGASKAFVLKVLKITAAEVEQASELNENNSGGTVSKTPSDSDGEK